MSLHEVATKAIITKINNATKIALFSEPLYSYAVKTVASDNKETITKAVEDFHSELANTFGLMASTITIYKNVANVEALVLCLELLYKDKFASENQIEGVISSLQDQINESYASDMPVWVSF